MRRWTRTIAVGTISLLIFAAIAAAQNAPKQPKPLIPLKVNVVFNEYEGAKRVSSLPYTLSVNANGTGEYRRSSLRMGLRVPFRTGGNQFQYQNVGTEIDCLAQTVEAGSVEVSLDLRRSSVYSAQGARFHGTNYEFDRKLPETRSAPGQSSEGQVPLGPIFSQFSTNLNLVMHDGQTIQSTMATDPVSGHVIKVDVTLHVVKGQ